MCALPEAISGGGLTPTTDIDLFLATYRGGNHLTSDIFLFYKMQFSVKQETSLIWLNYEI